MRKLLKRTSLVGGVLLAFLSCSEFEDLNIDPVAASGDQVQIEYFINSSIGGAQMNPHIAERVFVLYWNRASRLFRPAGISTGSPDDGWSSDYYNDYISKWLRTINAGIKVADQQIDAGIASEHTPNLKQVARIWRAYVMSEMADNFGSIPIDGFQGVNPEYSDVKTVYYYILDELKEATSAINLDVSSPGDALKKLDPAYEYDFAKWRDYGNSLRMRLAMRLSEVDPAKAQQEFESAVASGYIKDATGNFSVNENNGWDDFTGVNTRTWYSHEITASMNNLMIGLGGIASADQLLGDKLSHIKPANYMGIRYDKHFTTKTNDPSAGFFFDGLQNTIDPRAYALFTIPGDYTNPEYIGSNGEDTEGIIANIVKNGDKDVDQVVATLETKFTWNAYTGGNWVADGVKIKNELTGLQAGMPRMIKKFRNGTSKRIFFASWESYFLIAEAAVRGWTVPMDGQTAYEQGIADSFAYNGVSNQVSAYITSEDYSRVGTSVSWNHTTEPPVSVTMDYVDGYTGVAGTMQLKYPENTIYKNGAVKNDLLTKIITQKYIAQAPWLPLEMWNDQRRLGLPFFENPAVEIPFTNMPALTEGNYMTNSIQFFPQRLKYPSNFSNNIPNGYAQAVDKLGGPDSVFTPLWWAQQN